MSPGAGRRDWGSQLITPLIIVGVVAVLHVTGLGGWLIGTPAANVTVLTLLVLYFGFVTFALLFLNGAEEEDSRLSYWFFVAFSIAMTLFSAALLFGAI